MSTYAYEEILKDKEFTPPCHSTFSKGWQQPLKI